MDISNMVFGISIGTIVMIATIVVSILTYRLNKQKNTADTLRQAIKDKEQEDSEKQAIALQLTEIKIELVHIRERQDEEVKTRQDHEKRIQALERASTKRKLK